MAIPKPAIEQSSSFKVTFKGLGEPLRFLQASGLDLSVAVKEVPNAANSQGPVLIRDRCCAGRLVLSKGSGLLSEALHTWLMESLNPDLALKRHDVEIVVSAHNSSKELRTFTLHNAFPLNWSGPLLNTETDQQTIDHISVGFESLTHDRGQSSSKTGTPSQVNYPSLTCEGEKVQFHSQPLKLKIHHGAEFGFLGGPGWARPQPEYWHGRQRMLTTELVIDWDLYSQQPLEKDAIYKMTDTLQSFMAPKTETSEPSIVTFVYGLRRFEGFLSEFEVNIEKFSSEGYPLRVVYGIALIENFDAPPAEDMNVF